MTSSDIISIVAIVLSAVVSVVSVILTFKNNKANITAKRAELVLEKRLDAFVETIEQVGNVTHSMAGYSVRKFENKKVALKYIGEILDNNKKLMALYKRHRIYLSPDIALELEGIMRHVNSGISSIREGRLPQDNEIGLWLREAQAKEKKIVRTIQEYIGL